MVPAVASIPTCRLRVISPIHSAVGRMTPSTLRVASITGRLICWMVRKALPMLCCMPISPRTSQFKQFAYGLQGKFVNNFKERGPVRTACAVSQIDIIILRHQSAYFVQNGQTAVAGVEYTDGTGWREDRWDHGSSYRDTGTDYTDVHGSETREICVIRCLYRST